MRELIHSMIRVPDPDRAIRFHSDVLGWRESHRLDVPDVALVDLRDEASGFEIEPTRHADRTARSTHGDGSGHIAIGVTDVPAAHRDVTAPGHAPNPVKAFERGEELLARFFFVQDPDGSKIERHERHGRDR